MVNQIVSSNAVKLLRLLGAGIAASLAAGMVMSILVHVYFAFAIRPDPEAEYYEPPVSFKDFVLVIIYWSLPFSFLTGLLGHIIVSITLIAPRIRNVLSALVGGILGITFFFVFGGTEKLGGTSLVVSSFKITASAMIGAVVGFTFFKVRDKIIAGRTTQSAPTSNGSLL